VRIGVYVDGFNLYYGARGLCGRGTPGWRWLDLRALAADLVGRRASWAGAQMDRVVYCTARIDGASNPSGQADQDVYLKALVAAGSVDHIEYGTYVARVKTAPLAVKDAHGRPRLVGPAWPVMIQDGHGGPVTEAMFMVSYANREEKGSMSLPTSCWTYWTARSTERWSSPMTATCGFPSSRRGCTCRSASSTPHATTWPATCAVPRRQAPDGTGGPGCRWPTCRIASFPTPLASTAVPMAGSFLAPRGSWPAARAL
jgi:hypothetical protein